MHPSTPSDPAAAGTSARKIEANRENAKKSTGPRSEPGKLRSSRNAIRHSFLAQPDTLLAAANQELETLLTSYSEQFRPSGVHEELLVRELAVSDFQLRRITRIENAILYTKMEEIFSAECEGDLSQAGEAAMNVLMAAAWADNLKTHSLLVRYHGQARRAYNHALKQLKEVRTGKAGYLPQQPAPRPERQTKPTPETHQTKPPAPPPAAPAQTNPPPRGEVYPIVKGTRKVRVQAGPELGNWHCEIEVPEGPYIPTPAEWSEFRAARLQEALASNLSA